MTNKKYLSGRRVEWLWRKVMTAQGYRTLRAAGSKGPVDVIAWDASRMILAQVKRASSYRAADRAALVALPRPPGVEVVIVLWSPGPKWTWIEC